LNRRRYNEIVCGWTGAAAGTHTQKGSKPLLIAALLDVEQVVRHPKESALVELVFYTNICKQQRRGERLTRRFLVSLMVLTVLVPVAYTIRHTEGANYRTVTVNLHRFFSVVVTEGWCGPRCIATIVNYYFGWRAFSADDIYKDFGLCDDPRDIKKAIEYYIRGTVFIYSGGRQDVIMYSIDNDQPLVIKVPGHFTVCYGYRINLDNNRFEIDTVDFDWGGVFWVTHTIIWWNQNF